MYAGWTGHGCGKLQDTGTCGLRCPQLPGMLPRASAALRKEIARCFQAGAAERNIVVALMTHLKRSSATAKALEAKEAFPQVTKIIGWL